MKLASAALPYERLPYEHAACCVRSVVAMMRQTMAAPFGIGTKEEQPSVIVFLWSRGVSEIDLYGSVRRAV